MFLRNNVESTLKERYSLPTPVETTTNMSSFSEDMKSFRNEKTSAELNAEISSRVQFDDRGVHVPLGRTFRSMADEFLQ